MNCTLIIPDIHDNIGQLKKIDKQFSEMFGIQTCLVDGPYAWDVEAVLERIASGRLTGTQHPMGWD